MPSMPSRLGKVPHFLAGQDSTLSPHIGPCGWPPSLVLSCTMLSICWTSRRPRRVSDFLGVSIERGLTLWMHLAHSGIADAVLSPGIEHAATEVTAAPKKTKI